MRYLLLLISVFIISCSASDNTSDIVDLCNPNPCKDSQIAHKTICEKLGDDDFKCVCESGFNYEDGVCKEALIEDCIDGTTECNFNDLLFCENGSWEVTDCSASNKICKLENNTASCVEDTPLCTESETKCEEDKLLTCENNTWTTLDCTISNKICEINDNTASCVEEVVLDGTIYPIRTGEVAQESEVTVKAFVIGVKLDNTSKIEGFFIQEPGSNYRGIYVYAKNRLDMTLAIGDEVSVTGIYKEYNNLSEIVVEAQTQVVKTAVSSSMDDFRLITANTLATQRVEEYESMLVNLKGVFTVGDRDTSYNLEVRDRNGAIFLLKDDIYSISKTNGDNLNEIRGVLTYNYGKFKILPRGDYDLIDNSSLCSQINCVNGEICEVTNEVATCVCDLEAGYFDDDGTCKNPCELDGLCMEENKHTCIATDAINYTCECDQGFEENNGVCTAIPYCDTATYATAFGLTGNALADELKVIVNRNFHSYGYDNGRIAMFSYIDNDNGTIMCIYTGEYGNHPYQDDFSLLNADDTDKPLNTVWNWEHTWPKSMLSDTNAKADLHHLFPTRAYVNSRRSNYPFGNVDGGDKFCDDGTDGPGNCSGYDYVSELKNEVFEVADQHKGDTARAMFYMLIKYKHLDDYINSDQFTTLRAWHSQDEVDQKERDRNDKVELFQHNRNPFVDCPQFVEALYQ